MPTQRPEPMILPTFESATGNVIRPSRWGMSDRRLPGLLSIDQYGPTVLDSHTKTPPQCPNGRHLWDAIEVTESEQDHGDGTATQPFRLALTCVRCGHIRHLRGTLTNDYRQGAEPNTGRVDPAPLRTGTLRAQHISRHPSYGHDLDTYTVHNLDDDTAIGAIGWAATRRGRHYFTGRLFTWLDANPATPAVEAPTALAVLRKLAKAYAGGAS